MRIRFIFCAFVQLTFLPSVLFAHAYLVKSVPAGRATLFSSPTKVQLWFNERLEPKYSSASVYDLDGKRVDADHAQVSADDPKQLSVAIKQLPAGRYTLNFGCCPLTDMWSSKAFRLPCGKANSLRCVAIFSS